jgi:ribosome modulation factor
MTALMRFRRSDFQKSEAASELAYVEASRRIPLPTCGRQESEHSQWLTGTRTGRSDGQSSPPAEKCCVSIGASAGSQDSHGRKGDGASTCKVLITGRSRRRVRGGRRRLPIANDRPQGGKAVGQRRRPRLQDQRRLDLMHRAALNCQEAIEAWLAGWRPFRGETSCRTRSR